MLGHKMSWNGFYKALTHQYTPIPNAISRHVIQWNEWILIFPQIKSMWNVILHKNCVSLVHINRALQLQNKVYVITMPFSHIMTKYMYHTCTSNDTNTSLLHYGDVIMTRMASQITSLAIVYSTVYSGADQSKHQSSASLAFVWEIHRGPVNFPHKWPVTRKMFPFDDVIMIRFDIM